jgi:hypothetical protein
MVGEFERIWCDECGVRITWTPVVIGGHPYCCHDCAVGLECTCARTDPRWEDDFELLWPGMIEGSMQSSYGIDYGFD